MIFIDYFVVGLYFALILGIGVYTSKNKDNTSEYFLANRNLGWFVIGASLFASNIGSEHLVGLAESGFKKGLIESQFEILAAFMLLILGWVFVPFYKKSGVTTMPEYLERRFSSSARMYLSLVSIFAYVITKISVTIFAGAVVFETLLGIDFWTGAVIVVIVTGLYTILGGLLIDGNKTCLDRVKENFELNNVQLKKYKFYTISIAIKMHYILYNLI